MAADTPLPTIEGDPMEGVEQARIMGPTLLDVVKDCDNFPYPCHPGRPHLQTESSHSHSSPVSSAATVCCSRDTSLALGSGSTSGSPSSPPGPAPSTSGADKTAAVDLYWDQWMPEADCPDPYSHFLNNLWTFHLPHDPCAHGLISSQIVDHLRDHDLWTEHFSLDRDSKSIHLLAPSAQDLLPQDNGDWQTACSRILDEQIELWRRTSMLGREILGPKKKGEQFPIVGAKFDVGVDRSAIGLLGMIGRGAHMTVYSRRSRSSSSSSDTNGHGHGQQPEDEYLFWIPRRSRNKSTYPGKLDQAVAGGVARGESPWKCIIREAVEEAGSALSDGFVRRNAKAAGTVTWLNFSDERAGPGQKGLINPGVLYVYDLELPDEGRGFEFEAVPGDIEGWSIMTTNQVMDAMKRFEFKPSCAVVMIDFFVRHGVITAENEPDYVQIVSRLHRLLPFPTSSRTED
ncbi:hypothetical protein SMACR_07688 [Sordaria macrospora]|uniref:Nudix hydrolase domain-containing protein n=1 Tax=Sordaria macrospora TaxID=5147 RepID=A0A8S9A2U0_SORMA|nr:hypothetical protein SMACR_07688 [Sordaria macrospora]KAH7635481.1 hypothetical protein B0T09DRAFT_328868 [Sordaria sp. MPI-SDFR-AT-0083]WPJ67414.1 hypothetical protein SMAC4_07688 [Sordaria macrospora]